MCVSENEPVLIWEEFYLIISSIITACEEDQRVPRLSQIHLLSALKMPGNVFKMSVSEIKADQSIRY